MLAGVTDLATTTAADDSSAKRSWVAERITHFQLSKVQHSHLPSFLLLHYPAEFKKYLVLAGYVIDTIQRNYAFVNVICYTNTMNILTGESKRYLAWFLVIVIALTGVITVFNLDFARQEAPQYGVTFSKKYALELQTDWQTMYLAILNDLRVDHLRLIAYWDEIERTRDQFDFSELDWQLEQAASRNVDVILVLGRRAPRWPECHDPIWIGNLATPVVGNEQFDFVRAVVEHYKNNQRITTWQLENEPLVDWFGECPRSDKALLVREVALIESLDDRPVVLTDSGELSHWQSVAGLADRLGITLYRVVWNRYTGFLDYFFVPPAVYRWKADLTLTLHTNLSDVIVTELQMEPWTTGRPMIELTLEEQQQSFDLKRFKNNINYTRRAGFGEVYFWGVEYWYWLKEQGHPEIWGEAKKLW